MIEILIAVVVTLIIAVVVLFNKVKQVKVCCENKYVDLAYIRRVIDGSCNRYAGDRNTGLSRKVERLEEENSKLKGVVAEVCDYVYRDK
jgi:hypothetical protein